MSDEQKPNFLSAGLSRAIPPRTPAPPPPPVVKRPKERVVEEENEQLRESAKSQPRENADSQIHKNEKPQQKDVAAEQPPAAQNSQTSVLSDEQLRYLAGMLNSVIATPQQEKKAKRRKVDLADLLIQTIATSESSEAIKEQFSKFANSQKTKINQGIFAPEALFTIYRSSAVQLGTLGKKISMGDLMAKALIAYIPEILKELEQEE